ncbi:p01990-3L [African swine fever virus]|uniref:p01990-3L n=1 Tax=African swine fever virus TaxID=10497 RepID=A0A2Z5DGN9_ASF|nr:p01990-3R [African swine fever virus]UYB79148.1 p01990-3 [Recombinant African swine fever virus]AXB49387.1 p01990-3L [African swine fever virus]AXB49392.1 p01990-3R [African swine fever virus]AXB49561.1 p01990-3L [African swine fever virus]
MFICDVWCLVYTLLAFLIFILKCQIMAILCYFSIKFIGREFTLYILLSILAVYYWQTYLDIESD